MGLEPERPSAALRRLVNGYQVAQAIHVAETLGIADLDAKFSDLNMLGGPGGQERTLDEFAARLAAGGFRLVRAVPTASGASVLEAVPA